MTQQTSTIERSQPEYEVAGEADIRVPMRDGVRLAADIFFPAKSGKRLGELLPTILQRTPYDKSRTGNEDTANYFASRGYVVVFQDTRGRFKSEGTFVKYLSDPEDGYDTIEWIAAQPWSNGKIGTFGISYGAHTQAALAVLDPPHLACTFMDCGGFTNAHDNSVRNGGAFELRQVTWAFNQAKVGKEATEDPRIRAALEGEDLLAWFARMPWKKGHSPLRWAPEYEDYIFGMWTRPDFDAYWKQKGICNELYFEEYADVPQMHMGSWYDPYTRTTTKNFVGLSALKKGPIHMVLGPWTHGQHDVTYSGDVDFGPKSVVSGSLADDYDDMRLRWFDRWLKGLENQAVDEPRVKLFVMGGGSGAKNADGRLDHGGRWREEDDWPLSRTQYVSYYLRSDGGLSTNRPGAGEPPSRYQFDPTNPVPTIGGNISSAAGVMEPGAYHQQEGLRFFGSRKPYLPLSSRNDVLVFQTQPFGEDLEVTGPIQVKLWASSSAPDTDFTAKLLDIYPPSDDYPQGFHMNITDGIIRARYRNGFERQDLMRPEETYEFTIELYPTSNLFARGHRIRVDISSSNFPRLDVNPNSGEPLGVSRMTIVAENTVFHDSLRPSHIVLPVIPAGEHCLNMKSTDE